MNDTITGYIDASIRALQRLAADVPLLARLHEAVTCCEEALLQGGRILFCGNGGSAADAMHLAGELVGRFNYDRPGMAGIALTADTSALTAIGNDYGFEQVFARQVEALGRPGDVLIALSTSGQSMNLVRALEAAARLRLRRIGFTGRDGGTMATLCEIELRAPAQETPLIQQQHMVMGHLLCAELERRLHPGRPI